MDEIRLKPGVDYINRLIKEKCSNTNDISDGYHTFGELYSHRNVLFSLACAFLSDESPELVWKSKAHSDGTVWDGWFIMGIGVHAGRQATYHLPISEWDNCPFARTLDRAPEYDGHTGDDVLKIFREIIKRA